MKRIVLQFLLGIALFSAQAQVVSTFAGNGIRESIDGTGGGSSFYFPRGVDIDASGNLYVADASNHKIRKISPLGDVTIIAGSGVAGSTNGYGVTASFTNPYGVAIDVLGNVYVADTDNNKIRKISPTGLVTTFAGNGTYGNIDGIGTAASFKGPLDVAVDPSGYVYVSDAGNGKIRKISPSGVVTTLAGGGLEGASIDGIGTTARFNSPDGIALDNFNNIYVGDARNNKIRKISPSGVVTTFAGSGAVGSDDGIGVGASFNNPRGVAVDASGNVYVADYGNRKIRKISPKGEVITMAGSGLLGRKNGEGNVASFSSPEGITVDASGNVYVADDNNSQIRKITPSGLVTTLAGSGVYGSEDGNGVGASFNQPNSIAIDAFGYLYVADREGQKIRKISPEGVVTTLAGSGLIGSADGGGKSASFTIPGGIAVDTSGNVFVMDGNNNIRKINSRGFVSTFVTGLSGIGVAIDVSGNLYVTRTGLNKISKITKDGVVSTLAGSGIESSIDGNGLGASFNKPNKIALDKKGNLYVSEYGSYKIRKISPNGDVTTLAGSGLKGYDDGIGLEASFNYPSGITVDIDGNVYVADNKIRKISPSGDVTTLVGKYANRIGEISNFGAIDVVIDNNGNLFVVGNNRIIKITMSGIITNISNNKDIVNHVEKVNFFPNPASRNLTIKSAMLYDQYSISNQTGHEIQSGKIESNTINVESLNAGVYFLKLQSESGENVVRKFVKQ